MYYRIRGQINEGDISTDKERVITDAMASSFAPLNGRAASWVFAIHRELHFGQEELHIWP